jgi:pentatricopeptide repeat protein
MKDFRSGATRGESNRKKHIHIRRYLGDKIVAIKTLGREKRHQKAFNMLDEIQERSFV